MVSSNPYPIQFSVDYPDRELHVPTTLLRPIVAIPILIVLATVLGGGYETGEEGRSIAAGAGGLLVLGPMLMILFRQKYPRWWFDWNVELLRFVNRVFVYLALMDDRYPATDEPQAVRLEVAYPDVKQDLNRWLPLVKWFLAIPHVLALAVLVMGAMFAIVFAWFAILTGGRYPRGLFAYVEGVLRWHNRLVAYAVILTTDRYPPFSLA
jgi:hypothetical protein